MEIEELIRKKHSGDAEQLNFIFSDEKKIIVTAPAGCGKTTAMISKIARELSIGNIQSNKKVLAMTFSVNAAIKIKDSLKTLLPELVENSEQYIAKVDIANYHNFAMKLLYNHGYAINQEFVHLNEFEIMDDKSRILYSFISSSDNDKLIALENAVKNADEDALRNVIDDYWDILDRKLIPNHVITYNGLLVSALKLLRKRQVTSFYQEYYQMVIVDEFQDTNLLGYLLIKKLIGDNIIIFLGDDIQKIYGFLGAINGIFTKLKEIYAVKEIEFHNNYRFRTNDRMNELDKFVRSYGENYAPSELEATIKLKQLDSDKKEDEFIIEVINRIISNLDDKVAVLVRGVKQAKSIISELENNKIKYFNALFGDTDIESIRFYSIAIEEFHKATAGTGKAVQRDLIKCLEGVNSRNTEIYDKQNKKYIYDALYKLLDTLFTETKKWEGTSRERYCNIDFILGSNGLKRMMEFIDEKVVLTTIHSAKGLEWEYVILPKINSFGFPNGFMCYPCQDNHSCNSGFNYCKFLFDKSMEKVFKEEISVLYVAITRARKDVLMTVNTGLNQWNHNKQISCLLNLKGLTIKDYDWNDIVI